MPYLTVCPGYKPGVFQKAEQNRGYPGIVFEDNFNDSQVTEQEIVKWFKDRTYDLKDGESLVFMYVYFAYLSNF